MLVASPLAWAAHFLASYITVAIWCEKAASATQPDLGGARIAVGVYTAIALAVIGAVGTIALKRYRTDGPPFSRDDDTPADRHRFLGYATLLLSALSFVATVYVSLAALLIDDCF
jgi:hypothetical protein